jgi:hypothetical protein
MHDVSCPAELTSMRSRRAYGALVASGRRWRAVLGHHVGCRGELGPSRFESGGPLPSLARRNDHPRVAAQAFSIGCHHA